MVALHKENQFLFDVYKIRVRNLREYADRLGQDKILAKLLGITPARLHSLVRNDNTPFTEKMARAIEQKLSIPFGSLDIPKTRLEQYKVPMYLLEDIIDIQNARPNGYFYYQTEIADAFFVQIINKSYEPHISMGSKILINNKKTTLIEGKLYIVKYIIENDIIKPLIRLYKKNSFFNLSTNNQDSINHYEICGFCETIILNPVFG